MMYCTLEVSKEIEFLDKTLEVIQHPAWKGTIDRETTIELLQNMPAMTYLLHQDDRGEYDYWLSHKKNNGEIHHRHFTITLFPDGWFFSNYQAPPREDLNEFIQGALACKD